MMRICHVPTIVSLRQLEDTALAESVRARLASVSPTSATEGASPVIESVGLSLPLYQYPAAGKHARVSLASSHGSDEVPVFLPRVEGTWDLDLRVLPGLDASVKDGKFIERECAYTSVVVSDSTPQVPILSSAMVVPVCASATSPTKPYSAAPPTLALPEPFLNLHNLPNDFLPSPSPTPTSSDEDALTFSASPDASAVSSPRSDSAPCRTFSSDSLPCMALTGKRAAPTPRSTLDTLVTALWDDCDARGLFRYDVSQCATRVLPGHWGWVAQLNEGRASKKRPTELRVDAVLQPFDSSKFHFGKAFLREVLLQFESVGSPAVGEVTNGWVASPTGARVVESFGMTKDPSLVMINVSPIDYGHILLTPRVLSQQPQRLDVAALTSALAFIREVANPTFRLGFNSLGAYATINHLHFQGYYLPQRLPCEKAATAPVVGFSQGNVKVSTLIDYPVLGWVVEATRPSDVMAHEADMVTVVMQICGQLQEMDQPFNVLFVDQGMRAFIWPQCYAERQAAGAVSEEMLDTGVNPAVFEIAGHLVLKRAQDYTNATDDWARQLLAGVSLTAERFEELTHICLGLNKRN